MFATLVESMLNIPPSARKAHNIHYVYLWADGDEENEFMKGKIKNAQNNKV